MPDIMAGHGHEWAKTVANDAKIGVPPTYRHLNGGASRQGSPVGVGDLLSAGTGWHGVRP